MIADVLAVLNSAFAADPAAIHALVANRVPCNSALADHPTVVVDSAPIGASNFNLGMLGLLNGVVEVMTGKRVAVQWDGLPPVMRGFVEYTGG